VEPVAFTGFEDIEKRFEQDWIALNLETAVDRLQSSEEPHGY